MCTKRVQIVNLVGEGARLPFFQRRRPAVSALIVKNDAPIPREHVPHSRGMQIRMVKTRSSVHQYQGNRVAAADDLVIDFSTWTIKRSTVLGSGRVGGSNDNDKEGCDKKEPADIKGPCVYSGKSTTGR